ncbi:hypothetical protein S7711_07668 [Stachybotrys chartarum IBT 7711]|uniref:DUF1682 domain protein n=1 Tax=Stachybotrys chartarum (strain CBS 109288 / IBT 7711) TaxID=1280523 RepID=A0A084AWE7_STACB|nr:hypothetical protein S7711_07668 [Stachybotrys chartarum IBT 7711]KFA51985.1 hypothetical protein S40293_07717 [Stachybotrys chartarum IBT 40293]KFA74002.1 hypothetical protein S40288_09744 [Stachybotrys chartarum IBT 40288]
MARAHTGHVWKRSVSNVRAVTDFADFAGAPDPIPEPEAIPSPDTVTLGGSAPAPTQKPYTAWYNVHERHSLSEFQTEGYIILIISVVVLLHLFGSGANRNKAKKWVRAHAPVLTNEFAVVGFNGVPTTSSDVQADSLIREKSLFEFASYATGRQNVAFMDVKLTLIKRFNPFQWFAETSFGFFLDSQPMPADFVEATVYPFDGKENLVVPPEPGSAELRAKDGKSTYDPFVWALVNKDRMKKLREDRYDVSLTSTKDNSKLPNWLTVMSENAEVTELLLTPELIEAAVKAGDAFDYLVVSDQPVDKPSTLDETAPRKRVYLKYQLPSNNNYEDFLPLFTYFIRLPDILVQSAHFRAEVNKKLRATRDSLIFQLKKAADEEKSEERAQEREKAKKAKRDAELKTLDAKAQKKYLEKEKEKELRKSQKKMRG